MGNSLGEAVLHLVGDSTKLDQDVKTAKTTVSKTFSDMGGKLQKTGAMATAAISAPLALLANDMINNASDLNETVSKIGIVFGSQAEKILAFGETSAQAFGMSKNEALSAAGIYGNLFRALDMSEEKSAEMSMGLVGLAGDLASFNNMDPATVLDSLRAGLTGETEPLKKLGININQALIAEKALEMGLISEASELDANTKAQATYALVLSQTTLAQGDFARTSDGLANSQRIMKAELANVSSELGVQLLPLALKVVTAISKLVDKFSGMSPGGQKAVLVIGGIAAAIGPVITIIGTVMKVVGGLMAFLAGPAAAAIGAVIVPILPIIAIVAAVIAVIALLFSAWKNNWFGIRDITANVIEGIVNFWNNKFIPAIKAVASFVGKVLLKPFIDVKNAIMAVWDWLKKLAEKLMTIKLPDWMTPGSPTPWENGLRGVSGAMNELSNNSLPGMASASGMGGAGAGGSSSKNITIHVNNPIGENSDASVRRSMNRLQYLGEA